MENTLSGPARLRRILESPTGAAADLDSIYKERSATLYFVPGPYVPLITAPGARGLTLDDTAEEAAGNNRVTIVNSIVGESCFVF